MAAWQDRAFAGATWQSYLKTQRDALGLPGPPGVAASASDDVPGEEFDSRADEEYANISEEEAAEEFLALLIDLKLKGTLPATLICVLAFWASKAKDKIVLCAKLAQRPGQQSGKYSRHFDSVVPANIVNADMYELTVSCSTRYDATRKDCVIQTIPPMEAFDREIRAPLG